MAAPPSADGPMASVKQCLTGMRWVTIELHSVGPVGSDPMCGLFLAVSELHAAMVKYSSVEDGRQPPRHSRARCFRRIGLCREYLAAVLLAVAAGEQIPWNLVWRC